MASSDTIIYENLRSTKSFWACLAVSILVIGVGLLASHHMEASGHWVTGMNNQVVWGMPHVFAVFLIVAASGSLNTASIASVFGQKSYKPLSRISGLLAISLLIGGLTVLVLDLGRPDRLIIAMTYYNFKSIFAWNIFLYTGFIFVVAIYLWMMFESRMNKFIKSAGTIAFGWRLILTTGTGSIFGFLVAREAFDSAVLVPLFIIMSLSFGTALTILICMLVFKLNSDIIDPQLLSRLRRLLAYFIVIVMHLVVVDHLTKLYVTGHHKLEFFLLVEGGIFPILFWAGQMLIGSVIPLILLFSNRFNQNRYLITASFLVIVGAFSQLYVLIIGGQAFPLDIFPGYTERSSFFDGVVGEYSPSLAEFALGFGGFGLALAIILIGSRVLPFLPRRKIDKSIPNS